ncbi:MAG: GNAT family N-acetyltransferase [Pseudomonadota bacterium]
MVSIRPTWRAAPPPSLLSDLLDQSLGTDRTRKPSYRLREAVPPIDEFAVSGWAGDQLIASTQFWPIELRCDRGGFIDLRVLLFGPLAVHPAYQACGLGFQTTNRALALAERAKVDLVILVGEPGYYERFGFSNVVTQAWHLAGLDRQDKLMARAITAKAKHALPICAEIRKPSLRNKVGTIVPRATSIAPAIRQEEPARRLRG